MLEEFKIGFSKEVWVWLGTGIGLAIIATFASLSKKLREHFIASIRHFANRHTFPQKKDAEQNREIYTELVELRALVGSDRAYIMRFHNGFEFLMTNPVWKISCTHEVVKHGVTYEAAKIQSVLVSMIPSIIDPVITGMTSGAGVTVVSCMGCPFKSPCDKNNKHIVVIQVEEMDGSFAKFHLEDQNIKTLILSGTIKNGQVFGIAGIDFCKKKVSDPTDILTAASKLCRAAERIQYLLLYKKAPEIAEGPQPVKI